MAVKEGKEIKLVPMLVSEAYEKLMAGDKAGHDEVLAAELSKLAARTDIVVLAQASMARVLSGFEGEAASKFVSSPRLGMQMAASALSDR
jgi:hypothetical protein